jgi:nucleoside-diphosphate-sugar epimerase
MRVLLTGASGFLGRHVLEQLAAQDVDVVVVGRVSPIGYSGEFITADLLEYDQLQHVVDRAKATHLVHLAWETEYGNYWNSLSNLRWLESTLRLVERFCDGGGEKVVAAGTCAEYDWTVGYCREDSSPLNPSSLYGKSKNAANTLAATICHAYGAEFAWGRIFCLFGLGEDPRRLVPSLIDVFENRRSPFPIGINNYRDFLHVSDVARGLSHLCLSDAKGSFNISSGHPIQLADIVRFVAKALGANADCLIERAVVQANEPELLVGDNKKLRSIGWAPSGDPGSVFAMEIPNLIRKLGSGQNIRTN